MPKQGQFAGVSRQVHIRDRRHRGRQPGTVIDATQLSDFLLARYALTTRRQLPKAAQETGQRFLQELADRLPKAGGPVDSNRLLGDLLAALNPRVPWQFFWQLSANWAALRGFLAREVSAIPLRERVRLTTLPDPAGLARLLAPLVARRAARSTTLNQGLPDSVVTRLATGIEAGLWQAGQLDWAKVAQLLDPVGFPLAPGLDPGTREWLRQLSALQFPGK